MTKDDVKKWTKAKLVLENEIFTLPNPSTLQNDGIVAPAHLPDTTYTHNNKYLIDQNARRAFNGGNLLDSGQ